MIEIKILHFAGVKDKYFSFKFSNFENYYGLLDSAFFRLFEFGNSLSICDINLTSIIWINSDNYPKIKNFCFGPKHDFGWQNFSIFFISSKGEIFIVCPIFPRHFQLSYEYLEKIEDFHNNSSFSEEHKRKNKLLNILNINLIKNIKDSIDKKQKIFKVNSNKYLLEMNKNPVLNQIIILDKRDSNFISGNTAEITTIFQYNDIIFLDSFPICIMRKSDLGLIDIILLNELIYPIRNDDTNVIIL